MVRLESGWTPDLSLPHTDVPLHATLATLIHKSDGVWLVVSSQRKRKRESRIAHSVILSVSFIDIRLLL